MTTTAGRHEILICTWGTVHARRNTEMNNITSVKVQKKRKIKSEDSFFI